MAEAAIQVTNLSKSFKLPTESSRGVKQAFINWTRGIKGYKKQQVLDDISFAVEKGDFFGIVGRNGCGKSTLLKLIAGIYLPNAGGIHIDGTLVSFIELGVGFNPELSGRDNVYLNGALLGFSRKEVDAMYDEIVDFAELHDFMEQKLKNYSSGMQVRLAFSCAIRAKSDILVLDEVLAVGDEAFQRKCNTYFEQAAADMNQTIVLVTHSMDAVKKYCNKALLICDGSIKAFGDSATVANEYSRLSYQQGVDNTEKPKAEEYPVGLSEQVSEMCIELISEPILSSCEELVFDVIYHISDETPCFAALSISKGNTSLIEDTLIRTPTAKAGTYAFRYAYELNGLHNGDYHITAALFKLNKDDLSERQLLGYSGSERAAGFSIINSVGGGLLVKRGRWIQAQKPENFYRHFVG